MYYLQSRYYDPEIGRFINSDDPRYLGATISKLSYNSFAYCENNCVNYFDMFGYAGKYILKDEISLITITRRGDDYVYMRKKPTVSAKAWKTLAYTGVFALSNKYPNGIKFYKHCLNGEGQALYYNYNEAIEQDVKIRKTINSYLFELKNFIIKYYGTKTNYSVCRDEYFSVDCDTDDWKFALGTHQANFLAYIVYNSSTKEYNVEIYLIAIDLYNFNKNSPFIVFENKLANKAVEVAISKTGIFIETGLAHDFYSYGIALLRIKWKVGDNTITYTGF